MSRRQHPGANFTSMLRDYHQARFGACAEDRGGCVGARQDPGNGGACRRVSVCATPASVKDLEGQPFALHCHPVGAAADSVMLSREYLPQEHAERSNASASRRDQSLCHRNGLAFTVRSSSEYSITELSAVPIREIPQRLSARHFHACVSENPIWRTFQLQPKR